MSRSNSPDIQIRPFSEPERDMVIRLAGESGHEADEIGALFRRSEIIVPLADGRPAGMAAFRTIGKALVINDVAVDKAFRRQGIATFLLNHIKATATARGCRRLEITTSNDNIPALACYQKFGFHIREVLIGRCLRHHGGEIPGWQGIPVRDEIVLEMQLVEPENDPPVDEKTKLW